MTDDIFEEAGNSHDSDVEASALQETAEAEPKRDSEWALTFRSMSTTAIVLGATLMILGTVHPQLILRNNTPTGGDMGAHVWGPAYLRDFLLPHWKLTGWTMDWYAGFPMYRFYMVVPALLILLLNIVLPYGIAFKIIAVLGLVAFPTCAWGMAKVAKLPYPLPELFVVAATMFLYDESFTIYGGNIASTMAGEFSFSIALALSLVALGLFARGLDDGKYRPWAALCVALAALCHGIVLIFVFGGVALMWLLRFDRQRTRYAVTTIICSLCLAAFWVVPFLGGHTFMTDMKYEPRPSGANDSLWKMFFPLPMAFNILLVSLALIGFIGSIGRRRFLGIWLGVYSLVLMVGVDLAQHSLPIIGLLWNPRLLPFVYLLRYLLAGVGVYEVGVFVVQSVQLRRSPGTGPTMPGLNASTAFLWSGALIVMVVLGVRYQSLPFASLQTSNGKTTYNLGPIKFPNSRAFSDGWARWNFEGYEGKSSYAEYHAIVQQMQTLGNDANHGCGRALWENNSDLNKYGTTMALMLLPYWTKGCISSMEGLYFEAAGTTPYHFITAAAMSKQSSNPVRELRYDNNDAAKGVDYMRQLGIKYFMGYTTEAINAASKQPDLVEVAVSGPWHVFELRDTTLVEPLAVQPVVVNKRSGDQRERWLEVGTSYFQHRTEWPAVPMYNGPADWQHINVEVDASKTVGSPGQSAREVDIVNPSTSTPITVKNLDQVNVTNVKLTEQGISFHVDKIGVPVLVKVSYFPNWTVSGAGRVYRAAPNMMVVVPTKNDVSMSYNASNLDHLAYLVTFIGIAMFVFMLRRPFRYGVAMPERAAGAPIVLDTDDDGPSDS